MDNYKIEGDFIFRDDWHSIRLVTNKFDNQKYLLRQYYLDFARKYSLESMIHQDEHLLLALRHWIFPFTKSVFEEKRFFCIIQEYVGGLVLSHVIKKYNRGKGLPEDYAKFIGGQVMIAMEYLHKADIMVKDLHVKNIMLAKDGYIKLRINQPGLTEIDSSKTQEPRGRIYFLSPEYIQNETWTLESDWWSYGCLIYHLVSGKTPFESRRGLMSTLTKIQLDKFKCPRKFSFMLTDLLKGLLTSSSQRRYSCNEVCTHRWFSKIDFKRLVRKGFPAPAIHAKIYEFAEKVPQTKTKT